MTYMAHLLYVDTDITVVSYNINCIIAREINSVAIASRILPDLNSL